MRWVRGRGKRGGVMAAFGIWKPTLAGWLLLVNPVNRLSIQALWRTLEFRFSRQTYLPHPALCTVHAACDRR
jgi:hypothetical protein